MIEIAGPARRHGRRRCPSDRRRDEPAELAGLRRIAEQRDRRERVDDQPDADTGEQRRADAEQVDHLVPRVADDRVEQQHRDRLIGVVGRELGDEASAHRVPGEHRLVDAEMVERLAEQLGVAAERAGASGQTQRGAVAGDVDGHHLEAQRRDARQRLRVEDPLGREAVHDHQRHAATTHRDADLVTVVERDQVPRQLRHDDSTLVGRDCGARWSDNGSRHVGRHCPARHLTSVTNSSARLVHVVPMN